MNFEQKQDKFGPYTVVTIESSTGVSFSVIPEMGGRLNSFVVPLRGGPLDIIDGYTSEEELAIEYYSKSSLLAPFPNRIADGTYEFAGNVYTLPINKPDENNAIHGFISVKPFSVVRSEIVKGGYELELVHTAAPTEGYPFAFMVTVVYRLSESGVLTIRTEITNTGEDVLPIGVGWHPYFTTGAKVNDVELRLPLVQRLEVDGRLIPTGDLYKVNEWVELKSLKGVEFDTGFQFISEDKTVRLRDVHKNFEIKITCKEGYDFVQVFTPPWRTSIAIEPMTCAANAFNNKLGLQTLKPNERLLCEFEVVTLEE